MIKLSTAILLLVKAEPLVCSLELDLKEIFVALLVPYFDLNLSAMLEICRMYTRFKIKKEQTKNMFQDSRQRTPMETFRFKGARSTSGMLNTCHIY